MITRFFFIFAIAVLVFSCKSKEQDTTVKVRKTSPLEVEGFLIATNPISENVEVPGSLMPVEETQIRAEVSGRIVMINIQEGAFVKVGTILVKLFDKDLQAQLRKLQVQLEIAKKTVERQRELLSINGISQQDFDLSALSVDNLNADIETTRIALSKTEVRAPYDGRIGLRNVSLGSYISPNDIITNVRQVEVLKLDFSIPEKYAQSVVPGYVVKFRVDGGKSEHIAVVLATEGNVEQTTRTLKIKAIVKERSPELVPGIFAKINLNLGKTDNALMIPSQAIIPAARNKKVIVFHKDSALFAVVQTGIRDSTYVQILSGLQAGDTVVTTGLMAIRPKLKLKISKVTRYH